MTLMEHRIITYPTSSFYFLTSHGLSRSHHGRNGGTDERADGRTGGRAGGGRATAPRSSTRRTKSSEIIQSFKPSASWSLSIVHSSPTLSLKSHSTRFCLAQHVTGIFYMLLTWSPYSFLQFQSSAWSFSGAAWRFFGFYTIPERFLVSKGSNRDRETENPVVDWNMQGLHHRWIPTHYLSVTQRWWVIPSYI